MTGSAASATDYKRIGIDYLRELIIQCARHHFRHDPISVAVEKLILESVGSDQMFSVMAPKLGLHRQVRKDDIHEKFDDAGFLSDLFATHIGRAVNPKRSVSASSPEKLLNLADSLKTVFLPLVIACARAEPLFMHTSSGPSLAAGMRYRLVPTATMTTTTA